MREWSIGWRSPEIYGTRAALHVYERPWWGIALERAAFVLDTAIGHRWCAPPETLFKIPLGMERDEDGWYEQSIGSLVFDSFQWICCFAGRSKNEMSVDLSDEWLKANGQVEPW